MAISMRPISLVEISGILASIVDIRGKYRWQRSSFTINNHETLLRVGQNNDPYSRRIEHDPGGLQVCTCIGQLSQPYCRALSRRLCCVLHIIPEKAILSNSRFMKTKLKSMPKRVSCQASGLPCPSQRLIRTLPVEGPISPHYIGLHPWRICGVVHDYAGLPAAT